jgi:hypothetical protein
MLTGTPSWIDSPVRLPLYLNGRLLAADDLLLDQQATGERFVRLAGALGVGVASGLEVVAVPGSSTDVTIKPGMGVAPGGELLVLDQEWTLTLADEPADYRGWRPARSKLGAPEPPAAEGVLAYLLAASAEGQVEQQGQVPGYERRSTVVRIQVDLLPLKLPPEESGLPSGARLRNRLAYKLFASTGADLYGALEQTMGQALGKRLPLAVVAWAPESGEIAWVDRWSVRRRLQPAGSAALPWSRPPAVVEAMALQFQEQLGELCTPGSLYMGAEEVFAYLPPAGYLNPGVDAARFFHRFPQVLTPEYDPAFLPVDWEQGRLADPMEVGASAPPVQLFPCGQGQVLFLRGRRQQPPDTQPLPGAISIALTAPPDAAQAEAWATNDLGQKYTAVPVGQGLEIRSLPPAFYTVTIRAAGYDPYSFVDSVSAGTVLTRTIRLAPTAPPPQPVIQPPLSTGQMTFPSPVTWVGEMVITPDGVTDQAADLPSDAALWVEMTLPSAAKSWLLQWGAHLGANHPAMTFDLSEAKVIYNGAQFPQPADRPHALGVYGAQDRGPWVPITCVAAPSGGGGLIVPDRSDAPSSRPASAETGGTTAPNLADTPEGRAALEASAQVAAGQAAQKETAQTARRERKEAKKPSWLRRLLDGLFGRRGG